MKFIFLLILAICAYGFYAGDEFLAGAALSPLLIILGIWFSQKWL